MPERRKLRETSQEVRKEVEASFTVHHKVQGAVYLFCGGDSEVPGGGEPRRSLLKRGYETCRRDL